MPTHNTNVDTWSRYEVVSHRPAYFRSCVVANKNGTDDRWLWVCDAASFTPGASPAPKPACCPVCVPARTTQSIDRSVSPRTMQRGIVVLLSEFPDALVLPAANDGYFEVDYALP